MLLSSKITSLTEDKSTQSQSASISISETSLVGSNTNNQPSSATSHNNAPSHTHKVVSTESTTARKFNIFLFGLLKFFQGTKKFERNYADLKSVTAVLTEVDGSIQPFSP